MLTIYEHRNGLLKKCEGNDPSAVDALWLDLLDPTQEERERLVGDDVHGLRVHDLYFLDRADVAVLGGLLGLVDDAVGDGLAWEMRLRSLPSRLGVYFVLGLCLFSDLPYGQVRAKRGWRGGVEVLTPEYEDCARIARERGVALREVYAAIRKD